MADETSLKDFKDSVMKKLEDLKNEFGFYPYEKVEVISETEIKANCSFCGTLLIFNSLEEFGEFSSIDHNGKTYCVAQCPTCIKSIQDGIESPTTKRPFNFACYERLKKILEQKFDSKLIVTKANLFLSPYETIRFLHNKREKKYEVKLYVLLTYCDDITEGSSFNGINIEVDDINALDFETKFPVPIDNLVSDPEYKMFDVREEEVEVEEPSEPVTEEDEVEESAETEEVEDETVDETENESEDETEESEDDSVEEESETEDNSEVELEDESEETDDDTDTSNEDLYEKHEIEDDDEKPEVVTDDDEITDEKIEQSQEDYDETTDSTEEADDDKVEIDLTPKSENNSEDETDDIIEDEPAAEPVTDKDDEDEPETSEPQEDEHVVIDLSKLEGNDPFPQSSVCKKDQDNTEEEISDSDEETDHSESEENVDNPDDEITEESLEKAKENEDEKEDDEEDENFVVDLSKGTLEKGKSKKKSSTTEEAIFKFDRFQGGTDRLADEVDKIKEEEAKKWYNKVVKFDAEDDGPINEFMDEQDLAEEFWASQTGKLLAEIRNRNKLEFQLIINENTLELPFVDFNTGVRVICINCDEIAQMQVPLSYIEKNVKFSFNLRKENQYRKVYLYSDSLSTPKGIKATMMNLTKIINRDNFDPRRIINLSGNYQLYYTDHISTIRTFENENSSYPSGKPCTKYIGLIALRKPNGADSLKFTRKDALSYLTKDYKADLKSFNMYMVASARYIAKPNHETKTVEYVITDYTELSVTMIKDGLPHIIGAIIKEHQANRTVKDSRMLNFNFAEYGYSFEYEFDSATFPSPTTDIMYDKSQIMQNPMHSFDDGKGKCFIRVNEHRESQKDGWKMDPRLFYPLNLSKRFGNELKQMGYNLTINSHRIQFIERLGFVEVYYPKIKSLMVNPVASRVEIPMMSSVMLMQRVDLTSFFAGSNIYDGGNDNLLMQKYLISKMNGGVSDENVDNIMQILMYQKMMGQN